MTAGFEASFIGFVGNPLDRLAQLRDDAVGVAALEADATARLVLVLRDTPVLRRSGGSWSAFFTFEEAKRIGAIGPTALLGRTAEHAFFCAVLDESAAASDGGEGAGFLTPRRLSIAGRDDLVPTDMRSIAVDELVPRSALAILAQAKSLMHWHARHRCCVNCGAGTKPAAAGWRRECKSCGLSHFPRTDPVVIMLATRDDQCLLGRQAQFPTGMYSALAGFLEPGETIEEAARREIREETDVAIGSVTYVASQPWPFPASLMIGCLAQATSTAIMLDKTELEDARWFSRKEVRAMLESKHPAGLSPPSRIAIARRLIETWIAAPAQ